MAKITLVSEDQASGNVTTIFDEIKKTFGIDFVPNLFKAFANNPAQLEAMWNQYKVVMGPGEITTREKELIAFAVSATNNCEYCIHAHTAALKGIGLSEKGILEIMSVVGLYNFTNKFLDGLMIEPDIGV